MDVEYHKSAPVTGHLDLQLVRVTIIVQRRSNPYEFIEKYEWRELSPGMLVKWRWYFDYRQALLKVKYPKKKVRMDVYYYLPETRSDKEILKQRIKNLIVAKKRKVTEVDRLIQNAVKNWDEIFPIEDHPYWKKAQAKLQRVRDQQRKYEEMLEQL